MKQFHVGRNHEQLGVYPESGLQGLIDSGALLPGDLCWTEGMKDWRPIHEVVALASGGPPPLGAPPPLPAQSSQAPPARLGDDVGMRLLLPVGRSGWAIAAGYLGLFGLVVLPAPLALIISIIAIRDINRSKGTDRPKHGMGRAIFGLVVGVVGSAILLLVLFKP